MKVGDYIRHYESGCLALVIGIVDPGILGNPGWIRVIAAGIIEKWHHSSCEVINESR